MRIAVVALAASACGDNVPALAFTKRVVDPEFRAEAVTVFDVNRDNHLDLVTEELWYEGPAFTPHEIHAPRTFDALTGYASCFGAFHLDVDGDAYEDLIVFHFPFTSALWCRNPGTDQHWDCHEIAANVIGESPTLTSTVTGTPALLTVTGPVPTLGALSPAATPEQPWELHPLSAPDFAHAAMLGHGLGLGDLNLDGRPDVITGVGWFEQPPVRTDPWPFHAVDLCPNNCSHMFVDDLDGDGRPDILGASPHNYGAWWWRNEGSDVFTRHDIDLTNSQNHAARYEDLDGDGVKELITGKRYWAHLDQDPGAYDPVILTVYQHRLVAGTVVWDRTDLDADSGVGSHNLEVVDVDGNGKLDIVTSTKKGLFVFTQSR